jgi:hypothetical protein
MANIKITSRFIARLLPALLLININAFAVDAKFLTVDVLLANGYTQLTGSQLNELLKTQSIEIHDIETEAVYFSEHDGSDNTNNRKLEQTRGHGAGYLLNAELLARAPSLAGQPDYRIAGNELIAEDGVRTYHIKLYRKNDRIFIARDIDHGNVFYEIK